MFRNKSASIHQFSMVPSADVPRSRFRLENSHKTTFDAGYLIPVYVEEVLPGDTFNCRMTAFARLATPLYPLMDNMYLESFFFFVPNRLVWDNWQRFMGEQDNPGDSTSYIIPQCTSPLNGYAVNSLQDYFGIPTVGQLVPGGGITHGNLPMRAYNLIWNEWFRDENLQNSVLVPKGDGPDNPADFVLLRRGKRKDYFTGALPWPQKGESVIVPLGTSAPVVPVGSAVGPTFSSFSNAAGNLQADSGTVKFGGGTPGGEYMAWADPALYADLSQATAATINQLRQAFQIQKLLERDARGGTRYIEIMQAHFKVRSPDARLQRPEYLGGGSTPVVISPIAQTSGSSPSGDGYTDTPQGNLAAIGTALARGHGFSQSFTEHGHVIGMVMVRADLTYQQGMRRFWRRRTRYDFYFPAFAMLGEQAILNSEIYHSGEANEEGVFGYQERWAEYRYSPSMISGLFRSTAAGTLDAWHLAQRFSSVPLLNSSFIQENPPVDRIVAVGEAAGGQQFICDMLFQNICVRPLPMYSVPGLIDHF